jgi:nicotinamidase/pyrazinamidase
MKTALVIVDVQNDFLPGGSLAVPDGDKILPKIRQLIDLKQQDVVVWTKDWHPEDHCSFTDNGGQWPTHCVQSSKGAEIHKDIQPEDQNWVILKGYNKGADSYSAIKDNDGQSTGLAESLKKVGVKTLYVCGLATEYCVKFTVLDAIKEGFIVRVVEDACKGLGGEEAALKAMQEAGTTILMVDDLL